MILACLTTTRTRTRTRFCKDMARQLQICERMGVYKGLQYLGSRSSGLLLILTLDTTGFLVVGRCLYTLVPCLCLSFSTLVWPGSDF